jgi:hypothetical protein
MNITPVRLEANRANAQLSTGPRTEEGKAKVSLNAVKTALTGCTVLLPSDDADQYRTHIAAYEKDFQPVGPEESALVQSLADIRWRLDRIPGLGMAFYVRGRMEFAAMFEAHPEQERAALSDLQTFPVYEKQLKNLQLQESRPARRREKELAELHALQQERKAKEAEQTKAANAQAKTAASVNSFEFSNPPVAALSSATPATQTSERSAGKGGLTFEFGYASLPLPRLAMDRVGTTTRKRTTRDPTLLRSAAFHPPRMT